jgi:hypothetical protein
MKIKREHLPLGFALGCSLVLGGTLPAGAQTGNQSDITGVITTTSDIAGGAFAPGGTITTFTNPDIQAAVDEAAALISTQLAGGALPVAATNTPITSISATVQQSLQSLLTETGNVAAVSSQIESALINAPGATNTTENTTLVRNLITSLQGLTAGGSVSPPELVAAAEAYNAVIDASNGAFLTNPPPELLAIQSALSRLVNAASEAQEED